MKKQLILIMSLSLFVNILSGCSKKESSLPDDTNTQMNIETNTTKIKGPQTYTTANAKIDFDVSDFEMNLSENLTEVEAAKISGLSDEEKKIILEKKENLLKHITNKFKANNINIQINEISGEIIMDSSILFANDEAEVSQSGKDFLKKFIPVYTSVLCDEEYKDFISKIIVEGHTDTNASYEYNKKLSTERADNVKKICLSDEIDIPSDTKTTLTHLLESVGCSYDRPVKDSAGNIDMTASRRVTFRFMINI